MTYGLALSLVTSIGFVGCLAFVVSYWWQTRGAWWKEEAGRFMMAVYVNLAILFLLVMVNQQFEDWPGRRWVTFILFLTYVLETWWPLRLLTKAQRLAKARKVEPND